LSNEGLSGFSGNEVDVKLIPHGDVEKKASKSLLKDAELALYNASAEDQRRQRTFVSVLEGDSVYVSETAPAYLVYNALSMHELEMLRTKYALGVSDPAVLERMSYMSDALSVLELAALAGEAENRDATAGLFIRRIAEQELQTLCAKTGWHYTLDAFLRVYGIPGNPGIMIIGLQGDEFRLEGVRTYDEKETRVRMRDDIRRLRETAIEQHRQNMEYIKNVFSGARTTAEDAAIAKKTEEAFLGLAQRNRDLRLRMIKELTPPIRTADGEECTGITFGSVTLYVPEGKKSTYAGICQAARCPLQA